MAITALQLKAVVTADTSEAEKGLRNVRKEADNAAGHDGSGGIKGFLGTVAGMVTGLGIFTAVAGGVSFLTDQVKDSITAAQNYQLVQAQTNAVLKSTGDASGQTADGIQKLAEQLSTVTPFSRDATQSAENMLLTFTNIKGNLPDVTKTTLDFATAMHMDATSAALQLGKALNDPATGYSKLQREGVTFTKAQIDTMKSMEAAGNTAGAQAIMLQELQKEFGGSATAAGSTFAGKLQILQNSLEDTKEKIGAALIPVLSALMTGLQPVMAAVTGLATGALGGLASFLTGTVIPAIQYFIPLLGIVWQAVQNVGDAFVRGLKPGLDAAMGAFSKMQGPGLDFRQIAEQINIALNRMAPIFYQVGQTVGQLATQFITNVVPALVKFYGFVAANVLPVLATLANFIITQVVPVVMQLVGFFLQHVLPVFMQIEQVIIGNVVPALLTIVQAIIADVWPGVQKLIVALQGLWEKIAPLLIPVLQFLGALLQNVIAPVLAHTVVPAIGIVVNIVGVLINIITGTIDVLTKLGGIVIWGAGLLWNTMKPGLEVIGNFLTTVFGPAFSIVSGYVQGLVGDIQGLLDILGHVKDAIGGALGNLGGILNGAGKSLHIPGFAVGTLSAPGGAALVGEDGPELVNLPQGSRVTPLPAGLSGASAGGGAGGGFSGGSQTIIVQLDGRTITQAVVKHLPTQIRLSTGTRSF